MSAGGGTAAMGTSPRRGRRSWATDGRRHPEQHGEPAVVADHEPHACPMPCMAHRGLASACRGLRQGQRSQSPPQAWVACCLLRACHRARRRAQTAPEWCPKCVRNTTTLQRGSLPPGHRPIARWTAWRGQQALLQSTERCVLRPHSGGGGGAAPRRAAAGRNPCMAPQYAPR